MIDIAFNGRVRKDALYRFRRASAPTYEYITALSLASAAAQLDSCGIQPEVLQFEGYLITPLRRDVE